VSPTLGEALTLVSKAGVDRHQYLDILTSTLFDAPAYKTYGGIIADGRFEPAGFAAPLGQKDIRLVLAAAAQESEITCRPEKAAWAPKACAMAFAIEPCQNEPRSRRLPFMAR
jgi:3-hydroxyisobutyrate dehydrogenase-like beta-hydroxyacid dehydrogenase